MEQGPSWASLSRTFAGTWEIQSTVLEERMANNAALEIQIIDVRERQEFGDALGHIHGARLLPLSELSARAAEIDRTRPAVTVCRSGNRSAQAAVLLQKAGCTQVANLAVGMFRWRADGFVVEGGAE